MADAFIDALADLKDALTSGDDVDEAITATATDHSVRPEALRNRATKAWGDLTLYGASNRQRVIEAIAHEKESDLLARARVAFAKPMTAWTEDDHKLISAAQRYERFWKKLT